MGSGSGQPDLRVPSDAVLVLYGYQTNVTLKCEDKEKFALVKSLNGRSYWLGYDI